jgi:hypothetical protein
VVTCALKWVYVKKTFSGDTMRAMFGPGISGEYFEADVPVTGSFHMKSSKWRKLCMTQTNRYLERSTWEHVSPFGFLQSLNLHSPSPLNMGVIFILLLFFATETLWFLNIYTQHGLNLFMPSAITCSHVPLSRYRFVCVIQSFPSNHKNVRINKQVNTREVIDNSGSSDENVKKTFSGDTMRAMFGPGISGEYFEADVPVTYLTIIVDY